MGHLIQRLVVVRAVQQSTRNFSVCESGVTADAIGRNDIRGKRQREHATVEWSIEYTIWIAGEIIVR